MSDTTVADEDCHCCGRSTPVDRLARMVSHPDVAICAGCADWLATRSKSLLRAVPVLPTDDLAASTRFWEAAGFEVHQYGDDFALARCEGVELHLVEARPEGRDRGAAYIHTRHVDAAHAAYRQAGLDVGEVRDQAWGMREFTLVDPGGNRVRIGQNS